MIRFNDDWLRAPEMSEWLVKVSNDDSRAYCRCCGIILRAHKSDLMTHSSTAKHAKNMSTAGHPSGPLNVQIVCTEDPNQPKEVEKSMMMSEQRQSIPGTPGRAQYAKKYRVEWEEMDELKDWLQPLDGDPSKAYCRVCRVQLRAHKHDLVLHGKSLKHKTASEAMVDNFVTVAFSQTLNGSETILDASPSSAKKIRQSEMETQEISDMVYEEATCDDPDMLMGSIKVEDEPEDKKPGEVNIIRVSAGNPRSIGRGGSMRKRRMAVSEVIHAIAVDEFTGYELLQIVKAAIPKL